MAERADLETSGEQQSGPTSPRDAAVADARAMATRRAHQQRVIADLAAAALTDLDLDVLFDKAVESTARHLGAPLCKVLELTPDGQHLLLRSGVGWRAGPAGDALVPTDVGSQAGFTLLQDRPVVVTDLAAEERFRGPALLEEHGVVSGMSTIIRSRNGGPWGVLGVHTTVGAAFDDDDVAYIDAVAGILSGAVARRSIEDELADALERLQVSERVRGAFISAVSHELRTPLQAIVGFAETLSNHEERLTGGQRQASLERLIANVGRLRTQIERVLQVGDLDRALVTANRRSVALDRLIGDVIADLEPGPIAIETDLSPIDLDVDAAKLQRVVAALVDNAVRASPVDGSVGVRLRASDDGATIEVVDRGPGMDPTLREVLFEPFVQGTERDRAPQPGIGVGLTLARGFVELHDGSIDARDRPGGGLHITVTLPGSAGD